MTTQEFQGNRMSNIAQKRANQRGAGPWKLTKSGFAEPQNKKASGVHVEADQVIQFANTWNPYGGASDEEIFVNFGMTRDRFFQKLWHCMTGVKLDREIAAELAEPYRMFHPQFI
ncbi:hypothetical protein [Rhodococcus sp. 008]|uniref:hypothetical protein n=1 Tax=Rhodococcus sp. 008 TaxID=1723645 RepID=UPI0012EA56D9|nr:hypothetical protein [Rhodococcus sp. 008]